MDMASDNEKDDKDHEEDLECPVIPSQKRRK